MRYWPAILTVLAASGLAAPAAAQSVSDVMWRWAIPTK